jgi:hypothetical protein
VLSKSRGWGHFAWDVKGEFDLQTNGGVGLPWVFGDIKKIYCYFLPADRVVT